MSKLSVPQRARALRRGQALTQKELARLIGCRCHTQISRIENGERRPSAKVLTGYVLLFDRSIEEMFNALFDTVEEHVVREAYKLHQELEGQENAVALKKRIFLAGFLANAAARHRQHRGV